MTRLVLGGPNDSFKRIEKGLCSLFPCPGHLLLRQMETREAPCPDWIKAEVAIIGNIVVDPVTVTTYTYRCVECGHEIQTTKLLDAALQN